MLQGKNIAVFIDVDNCQLEYVHYENAMTQINSMGVVSYGKLYGVSDKKNKEIIAAAENAGFDVALSMRVKKRGQKAFDSRILIDAVESVVSNNAIDAVAVVAAPFDMVYFYRLLRRYGVKIIACDNSDEESAAFIDEIIDLGKVEELKLPAKKKVAPFKKAEQIIPAVETIGESEYKRDSEFETKTFEESSMVSSDLLADKDGTQKDEEQSLSIEQDKTAALLKEIEKLRANFYGSEETAKQEAEEIGTDEEAHEPDIIEEAHALLDQIEEIKKLDGTESPAEQNTEEIPLIREETLETEPVTEAALPEMKAETAPKKVAYQPQSDSDLIRKIEEMRKAANGTNDDELVEQIKRLLDGLE